jgi:RNA polymerase sigma-70 factor (ECF subfamily)
VGSDPTDEELLGRFATSGEEAAFAELVRRYGPMVLGVCRRVLTAEHDAEDSFQATFLVLARRAGAIHKREAVGSWLYGVAYRIAARARADAARRRKHEGQVSPVAGPDPFEEMAWRELRPVLDEELARLPAKYRNPLVLCYLQGLTNTEAARELGWTKGTVSGRLARARDMLRSRLARRGLALTSAVLIALLGRCTVVAAVPPGLQTVTVAAATSGVGLLSPRAVELAGLILARKNFVALVALLLLIFTIAGAGIGTALLGVWDRRPAQSGCCGTGANPSELGLLQGSWRLLSREQGGKKTVNEDRRVFILDNQILFPFAGEAKEEWFFSVDPAATPRTMDLTGERQNRLAIYELKGDTLRLCLGPAEGKRPQEFLTRPGSEVTLYVFKRDASANQAGGR